MAPTPEESDTVESAIEQADADDVNGWTRVDPEQALAGTADEVLVQWAGRDGDLVVYVTREELDESVRYEVVTQASDRDVPYSKRGVTRRETSLAEAMDDAIQFLRRHRPDVPFPTFDLRIEGGILKPLVDAARRLGGGEMLWEVRDGEVAVQSASAFTHVEYVISAPEMEGFDVSQAGAFVVSVDGVWDALKSVNFSDVVPVSLDGREERPRLGVASRNTSVSLSAEYTERSIDPVSPFDAQFAIPGLEYRDKMRAVGLIDDDDAVFGVREGVAFIRVDDPSTGEEVAARFETAHVEGEQVVNVSPGFLQELRKAVVRPSQTDVTFTLKGDKPLLAEYGVDGTDVDVRVALKAGAVPREVDLPPVEVTVPEDDEGESAAEDVTEAFAAEAAAEAADTGEGEGDGDDADDEGERGVPAQFSRGQIETIVEEATVGVSVSAQMVGSELRELRLRVDGEGDVRFQGSPQRIVVTAEDDELSTVRRAIDRWDELIIADSLTREQVDDVNERREALEDEFAITIPRLAADVPPEEGAEFGEGVPFTAGEVKEIVARSVDGAIPEVSINTDADSLRIGFEQVEATGITFTDDLQEVQGIASDPVPVINEALAEWASSVDLTSVPRSDVTQSRERVESEFGIDLLEVGAVPPEDAGEEGAEAPAFEIESDVLSGAEVPESLQDEQLWTTVREVVDNAQMSKEEREIALADILEGAIESDFPGVFQRVFVDLIFSGQGGGLMGLEIGGPLTDDASLELAGGTIFSEVSAQRPLEDEPPRATYLALAELLAILDEGQTQFSDLQRWLRTVEVTDRGDITNGEVDLNQLFVGKEAMRPFVRRASRRMWISNIDGALQETSVAWMAAQRAYECMQSMAERGVPSPQRVASVDAACNRVDNRADASATPGSTPWYFYQAWKRLERGEFDPVGFLIDFFGVKLESRIGSGPLSEVYNQDGSPKAATEVKSEGGVAEGVVEDVSDEGGVGVREGVTVEGAEAADEMVDDGDDPFDVSGREEFVVFIQNGLSPSVGISPDQSLRPRQMEGVGIADKVAIKVRRLIDPTDVPAGEPIGTATVEGERVVDVDLGGGGGGESTTAADGGGTGGGGNLGTFKDDINNRL